MADFREKCTNIIASLSRRYVEKSSKSIVAIAPILYRFSFRFKRLPLVLLPVLRGTFALEFLFLEQYLIQFSPYDDIVYTILVIFIGIKYILTPCSCVNE